MWKASAPGCTRLVKQVILLDAPARDESVLRAVFKIRKSDVERLSDLGKDQQEALGHKQQRASTLPKLQPASPSSWLWA